MFTITDILALMLALSASLFRRNGMAQLLLEGRYLRGSIFTVRSAMRLGQREAAIQVRELVC